MKYIIIGQDSSYNLSVNVNEYMKNGWIPQGGVCVYWAGESTIYYQAMIKE